MKFHEKLIRKFHRLGSKGSALLTVILFVAFLSILATTLMYVVGMNFMIKQQDYQNKKNFYTGETALEEIKAMLMEDIVSEAAKKAYTQSCMSYCTAGGGAVREIEYNDNFANAVAEVMGAKIGATGTWLTFLNCGYDMTYYEQARVKIEMTSKPDVSRDATGKLLDETGVTNGVLYIDAVKGIVTIHGIKVTYVNENGLATIITTDLELHAPEIDWSAEHSTDSLGSLTQDQARVRQSVDVSRCVRYTNWVKR